MNLFEQATTPLRNVLSSEGVMAQLNKPGFAKWSVAGFILLNMVTSPVITMLDKKTPKKERTYSAERQFFQELLVLGSHLTIATQFEKWGAKLGALIEPAAFRAASKVHPDRLFSLDNFRKNAPDGWEAAQAINSQVGAELRQATNLAWANLIKLREVVIDPYVMGSRTAGATIGSIIATAIVGPKLNNLFLTPFLKTVNKGVTAVSGGRVTLPTGEETTVATSPTAASSPAMGKLPLFPSPALQTATVATAPVRQLPLSPVGGYSPLTVRL